MLDDARDEDLLNGLVEAVGLAVLAERDGGELAVLHLNGHGDADRQVEAEALGAVAAVRERGGLGGLGAGSLGEDRGHSGLDGGGGEGRAGDDVDLIGGCDADQTAQVLLNGLTADSRRFARAFDRGGDDFFLIQRELDGHGAAKARRGRLILARRKAALRICENAQGEQQAGAEHERKDFLHVLVASFFGFVRILTL